MKCVIPILLAFVLCSGCAGNKQINGKLSKNENKAEARIVSVETKTAAANVERLGLIGEYSFGLSLATNLDTAKTVNERILTLSVYPTIDRMAEMQEIVSALNNSNAVLLIQKDAEILRLQNITKILSAQKQGAVDDYIKLADKTAGIADTTVNELKEYTGWFGLKAVGKGLWQFGKSAMWFIGIGGLLFFILRILSMGNPLAASIFSLFSTIGSWFIHAIRIITPKALDMAGYIATKTYDTTKATLTKTVDAIEQAKVRGMDVSAIKDEVAKTMDVKHKDVISNIKKELNY